MSNIDLTAFEQYFTEVQTPQQFADDVVDIIVEYSQLLIQHSELVSLKHAHQLDTLRALYSMARSV